MQALPRTGDDVDLIFRRAVDARLRHIEEIALGLDVSGAEALSAEAAFEGILRSMGRDRKAPEEDVVYNMRADTRGWWRDFPEQVLLSKLYKRVARRKDGTASGHDWLPPEPDERRRVAEALLADIRVVGKLDAEWEAAAVSKIMAGQGMDSDGIPPRRVWRRFIKPSRSIPVYHDALSLICKKMEDRGKAIPKQIAKWQLGVADGSRERPDRTPLRRGRPANGAQLFRDIHMAFTIEILERLGVPPRGKFNRFSIVAEALGMSEKQVKRTWNARPWETSVVPKVREYTKGIAKRHGLDWKR